MRRSVWLSASLTVLTFLAGGRTQAQDKEKDNEDRQERFSIKHLDTENESRGRSSSKEEKGAVQVGPNVRVNDTQQPFPNGLLGRSETTSATDEGGKRVLVGFNDAQGFCGAPFGARCTPSPTPGLSGFGFSIDGGLTFTDGGSPPVIDHVFTRGDPWMDRGGFDSKTFFYANLSVHDVTGADLGVSVHRGHFNGGTFVFEDVRVFNAPKAPFDFYDKEAIAADKDERGTAYVTLTNFIGLCGQAAFGFGQIEVWRTHDGGDTWQGPVVVSPDVTFNTTGTFPANPNCGVTGILQQSSAPAIGPNGEVYVAWQFGPTFNPGTSANAQIRVARSLNGGSSFDSPVTVADINTMRQNVPVGYNRSRINDHPRIAVATEGKHKGRVFVVFYSAASPVGTAPRVTCPAGLPMNAVCIAQSLVSSQIFISFSDDKGLTWSTPTPIAPAVPATGVKRLWPVVTIGSEGAVHVVYYESQETPTASNPTCTVGLGGTLRRTGSANSLVDTFLAVSLDGGVTFGTPVKVTTATSNWCTAASNIRPNFGDYIGSSFGEQRLFPTWADSRSGVVDTFAAQVKVEN